jgi:cell division protein FtsW
MLHTLDAPRRLPSEVDLALLWSTLMLLVIGMVMVYSASMAIAEAGRQTGNQSAYFLIRHAVFLVMALVAAGHGFPGADGRPGSAGHRGSSSSVSCCWRWC